MNGMKKKIKITEENIEEMCLLAEDADIIQNDLKLWKFRERVKNGEPQALAQIEDLMGD